MSDVPNSPWKREGDSGDGGDGKKKPPGQPGDGNQGLPFGNIADLLGFGAGANQPGNTGRGNFGGGSSGSNMGFGGGGPKGPGGPNSSNVPAPKLPVPLIGTVVVLALLGGAIFLASEFWTEVLWFKQLGYSRVLFTRWVGMAVLFILGFLCTALAVGGAVRLVLHSKGKTAAKPRLSKVEDELAALDFDPEMEREQEAINQMRDAMEPMGATVKWGLPLALGVFGGLSAMGAWTTLLTWWNGASFGKKDPQFGLDVSFFVFDLPMYQILVSWAMTLVAMMLVVIAVGHFLNGTITIAPRLSVIRAARIQFGLLLALGSVLVGANYWLKRYGLLSGRGEPTDGALYRDINATLPAYSILAIISVLVAVLFVVAAFKGTWRLPMAGVVVTVVSSLVIGMAYPLLIQQFKVTPNARALEAPYIQRNIDATYEAYGMSGIEYQNYTAKTDATAGQLREDSQSTSQIRLLDPQIVPPTVRQQQQSRPYYYFPDQFAVDRYTVNGEKRDTVIAMREINVNGLSAANRSWVNEHTVYTHGFGAVAAYGNQVTADGSPSYWDQSIPPQGEMGKYEPRVYFSPNAPSYSIVGGAPGGPKQELDYPDDKAEGGQVNTTFSGDGGPNVGKFLNKLLYAIKFRSTDLFFSSQVNPHSQVLYDRDPALRVAKVAPYLTLDQRPYPAIVDMDGDPKTPKRMVWIIDGYTTSNAYPYSQHESLQNSTADSRTSGRDPFALTKEVNYIRNSVKAVVDAYDGSVRLFRWDEKDPVLKTWERVFPGTTEPISKVSGDLMSHLRYPEDLFKVQRNLLTTYHVRNASEYYTAGDRWKLSEDPTRSAGENTPSQLQPPYYLTMKMPGQKTAEFSLTSVFIPGGESKRAAMAGFLAVDSETGNTPGRVREGYGKLRLIALPSSTTVPGPGQVQNNFNSNERVNKDLNLQDQQGSKVLRGNLLTLPVGGGLLYVQPVYIQGTGSTQFPQLRSVLTSFGSKIGFAPTLQESLDQVFGGDSAAQTGPSEKKPAEGKTDGPAPAPTPPSEQLAKALSEAKAAMTDSAAAMKAGDWAKYGEAQKRLDAALQRALEAQGKAK